MAQQARKRKSRKRKGKIRISSSATLVAKNDKTRVAKNSAAQYPHMMAQMPRSNGMVFKVKVKHK